MSSKTKSNISSRCLTNVVSQNVIHLISIAPTRALLQEDEGRNPSKKTGMRTVKKDRVRPKMLQLRRAEIHTYQAQANTEDITEQYPTLLIRTSCSGRLREQVVWK
ncbi:hypothetical protein PanWU01x14_283200 [Parasponia andersonii]|uniref:Uncharacterized protein n=1 Tax=Parasponia andersonii TaxID=3476 RepID=A0A2P5B0D9_PARAD|nr:hypothetical protein PanWU01x14_283200 [Parasponia andersonii]